MHVQLLTKKDIVAQNLEIFYNLFVCHILFHLSCFKCVLINYCTVYIALCSFFIKYIVN